MAGHEKVPPLVEAEIPAEAYERVTFDLCRNVVHVAFSDEAKKRAAHDLLGLHVLDATRDLEVENAGNYLACGPIGKSDRNRGSSSCFLFIG